MQIFKAESESVQRGSRACCFTRGSIFTLLTEHKKGQMRWLALLKGMLRDSGRESLGTGHNLGWNNKREGSISEELMLHVDGHIL